MHCDLVVRSDEGGDAKLDAIGGNVVQSVTLTRMTLNANKVLSAFHVTGAAPRQLVLRERSHAPAPGPPPVGGAAAIQALTGCFTPAAFSLPSSVQPIHLGELGNRLAAGLERVLQGFAASSFCATIARASSMSECSLSSGEVKRSR